MKKRLDLGIVKSLKTLKNIALPVILLIIAFEFNAKAQNHERAEIPDQYKWNLKDLYASDADWQKAKNEIAGEFDQILQYKGKLSESSAELLSCMDFQTKISKVMSRLYSYASLKSDEDTRISENVAMEQELQQLFTGFSAKASFIEPEIVSMDSSTVEKFIKEQPGLQPYGMYLRNLLRRKAHTLSENGEKILAQASLMSSSPSSIYRTFSNAEMPYPTITLSDGSEAYLDKSGYSKYRALPNRADRELVFNSFWKAYGKFEGTYGEDLYANVKTHMFYARTRKYPSCLASALDYNNIPTEVYTNLIDNVNKNLGTFQRYLKLKKRMLGVDTLKYSDVYAPVVKDVDLHYTYEQAQQLILDALQPLGDEYLNVIKKAFNNRWIDVFPSPGKRSGAYSNGGVYDVHPYILTNFNGQYEDVSTLAHELGHTMQSYFSNKNQPYPLADYSIFVAEVASTFNEALLIHKMLNNIKDDNVKLSLLMNYLDNFKGTFFRQAEFAEFELRMHQMAEAGTPLTGKVLTKLYGDIQRKYYGQDKGICYINDKYNMEWAFIPHFYYNFYVYQYATSFTASTALAEKVLNHEKGATEKYMEFLSAGGSDYPISELKKAGVDMTTSDPFNKTMEAMNNIMDEIETILDKKKK